LTQRLDPSLLIHLKIEGHGKIGLVNVVLITILLTKIIRDEIFIITTGKCSSAA
jgi:hypothetical protein